MVGRLLGVGVGPGDPELLTLKAVRVLQETPVIAYVSAEGRPSTARRIAARHLAAGRREIKVTLPMQPHPELAHELAVLQPTADLDGALLCHASPRSDMETFAKEPSDADAALLADHDPGVIVFGHSHLQFMRAAGERLLVNPGSVGIPFDGDRRAGICARGRVPHASGARRCGRDARGAHRAGRFRPVGVNWTGVRLTARSAAE